MQKRIVVLGTISACLTLAGMTIAIQSIVKNEATKRLEAPSTRTPSLPTKDDLIMVSMPINGAIVHSPLSISGKARGMWFFEASFPIELLGNDGSLIAQGYATANGEWMTEDFVPFTATLTWSTSTTQTGNLILKKDNPSDLRELDDQISIPVVFGSTVP